MARSPHLGDDSDRFLKDLEADTFVVKLGDTFELAAKNELGEVVMASPAIAEGTLYLRGQTHLYAIGPEKK